NRGRVAEHVVGHRVPHQQDRDPGLVEDPGGGVVVGGEHDETLTALLEGPDVPDGDWHGSRLLAVSARLWRAPVYAADRRSRGSTFRRFLDFGSAQWVGC